MTKIAWLTDVHLNFLDAKSRLQFYQKVSDHDADAVLITGDIAEARDICSLLNEFSSCVNTNIYFVLGNHDYYFGSVLGVREAMQTLCAENAKLHWLGSPEIIALNSKTILVGIDGWADGRYGDFDHSPVNLNDSVLISDLNQARLRSKAMLKNEMQKLADLDALLLKQTLNTAIKSEPKKVIIATHVPPFAECCWHINKQSDENWQPYFSSRATGNIISDVAKQYPEIEFLVLCGHTHTESAVKMLNNLEILTGGAKYYQPEIQKIIQV